MNTITPDQVFLRDYSKIYTGTNQEGGYETPFLGFTTDTVALTLKADKSTYFHYPNTAEQISLSGTDLVESGAFADSIPFKADKIFKKCADYEKDTIWGKSLPESFQRGVWLCAWLSGNKDDPTQTPVWMDRWYDPGYLDSTLSLYVCSTSAVYDEPSRMTFDPGVWYRYDHIGNNTNLQLVDSLSGLVLHIDDWAETSVDTSGYDNNAMLQNYTTSMISSGVNPSEVPNDKGLLLNGINQYGLILNSSSFDVSGNFTCNAWIKSNWQNQPSHHFLSNGLRGGWSIGINTGFFTPFNVLIDVSGNMIFNNQTGNFYKDITLPGFPAPVSVAIDSELYTWVLDNGIYNGFKHLYKIDYNGNIENAVYFPTGIELYDIAINSEGILWVSNDQGMSSAFDSFCNLVSTSDINGPKLIINSTDTLTAITAIDACVFEDEYYWTIDNTGDIFYNSISTGYVVALTGHNASNIQCTTDHIWALYDTDKVIQFIKEIDPATGLTTFTAGISTIIPDTPSYSITGRNIFFTNEFVDNSNKTFIWILQPSTEYLYKYDTNLNLQQKISTAFVKYAIQTSAVKGDASGYQWHRIHNYEKLEVPGMSQIEASIYLNTDIDSLSGQKYSLHLPVSTLTDNDWHMFTLMLDNTNNNAQLYVDTILRDTVIIPPSSSIYYAYETPLLIGANVGKINTLDEEFNKINRIYHLGGIDDLRVYNTPISISDMRHIYLTKFNFKDLVWNMPSGLQSYVEEIVRFFKFKMPGQKSQYYNIHLKGLQISDESVRQMIEDIIRDTIQKIAPFYTSLFKIIWD